MKQGGEAFGFLGWEEFYPSAVAQVFSAACGFYLPDMEQVRELYDRLCEHYSWEEMNIPDQTFDWSVLSYIAIQLEDIERTEKFIEAYSLKYDSSREYPLHVAEAAWVARTCNKLIEMYKAEMDKNFFKEYIIEAVGL